MLKYISSSFKWFFKLEAASGLLLLFSAIIALIISNSTYSNFYFETLDKPSSVKKGLLHMHGLYTGHKQAKKIRILLSNSNYLKESKNQILSILEKDEIKAA